MPVNRGNLKLARLPSLSHTSGLARNIRSPTDETPDVAWQSRRRGLVVASHVSSPVSTHSHVLLWCRLQLTASVWLPCHRQEAAVPVVRLL